MLMDRCKLCDADAAWLPRVMVEFRGQSRMIVFDVRDVHAQELVIHDAISPHIPQHRMSVSVPLCWACIKQIAEAEMAKIKEVKDGD